MTETVVKRIEKHEWKAMAERAHLICFNEKRPAQMDRIDYALLNVRGTEALSYCTVRELDGESCYWQYGGAFPNTKGTATTFYNYRRYAQWCFNQGYKRVTTYIENTNVPMIKIALKVGFRIIGTRFFKGHILVEFLLEREDSEPIN